MHKLAIPSFLLAVVLPGCGEPPPGGRYPVLAGNEIAWSEERPFMASVRWRTGPGAYRAVSYPAAAERGDKRSGREHAIRLLSAPRGEVVHYQKLSRIPGGETAFGKETTAVADGGGARAPLLRWTMIDVGFGDAHLLSLPAGKRILVDGGERRDWSNVDRFLRGAGVRRLDVVVGSHVHVDHLGGLIGRTGEAKGVLRKYEIGLFLDTPDKSAPRAAYDEVMEVLRERGIEVDTVHAGDHSGGHPGLAWDPLVSVAVLNAGGGAGMGGATENDHINNDSIVLRIRYGDVDLLLGGDAEGPVEYRLQEGGRDLDAEVLKVHHHGVNDASTAAFLDAVNPRVALIPVASYETYFEAVPGEVLLERFRDRDVDVFASDRAEPLGVAPEGGRGYHVTLVTDGVSYEILTDPSGSVHFPAQGPQDCLEGGAGEGSLLPGYGPDTLLPVSPRLGGVRRGSPRSRGPLLNDRLHTRPLSRPGPPGSR